MAAAICIYCSYSLPKYNDYDSSAPIRDLAGSYPDKPVLCWTYGMDMAGFTRQVERDGTAMVFPSLDDAADALAKLAAYGENLAAAPIHDGDQVQKPRRMGM